MRKQIDSMSGQLTKAAGLYRHATRRKWGQTIVEGPQGVREVVSLVPEIVHDVYVTDDALIKNPDIDALLQRSHLYTHVVAPKIFARVTTTAQGIFAVIDIPDEVPLTTLLDSGPQLIAYAIEMSDPGNLGTTIRSADACGADAVILGAGSANVTSPKVVRSTAGSAFHLPILDGESVPDVVDAARAQGIQILAADGGGSADLGELADAAFRASEAGISLVVDSIDLRRPTMWLFGHEARGLTAEQRELADAVVSIPMWGKAESLNVAMAATLCLHASARAQRRA